MKLGELVKDSVTGIPGIITARCEYLHGNPRCMIESRDTRGLIIENWFDESRLHAATVENNDVN